MTTVAKISQTPLFDVRFLGGQIMRTIGTTHQVSCFPDDAINYLPCECLQGLATSIATAQHCTSKHCTSTH